MLNDVLCKRPKVFIGVFGFSKAMSQSVFGLIWIDSKFEEQLWDVDDRHDRGEKTDRAPSHDSLFKRGKRQGKKTKNK